MDQVDHDQVDIDYGTGETPRYARGWLTWSPTGELAKLEIRVGSVLEDLTPGSGGTLVYLTKWTYFGGSAIVERNEVPGTPTEKEYVSAAGMYLYQVDASDAYWYYHYDGDGSVAAITDGSKNITALYEYDAFGNKLTNAGTVDNAFGFYGGTLLEQFGLIHEGGPRFYEPETGLRPAARTNQSGAREPAIAVLAAFLVAGVFVTVGLPKRGVVFRISAAIGAVITAATLVAVVGGCGKEESFETRRFGFLLGRYVGHGYWDPGVPVLGLSSYEDESNHCIGGQYPGYPFMVCKTYVLSEAGWMPIGEIVNEGGPIRGATSARNWGPVTVWTDFWLYGQLVELQEVNMEVRACACSCFPFSSLDSCIPDDVQRKLDTGQLTEAELPGYVPPVEHPCHPDSPWVVWWRGVWGTDTKWKATGTFKMKGGQEANWDYFIPSPYDLFSIGGAM